MSSVTHIVHAHYKVDKCCFTDTRPSYNTYGLTGHDIERDTAQNIAVLITEADVIYRYLAGNIPLYRMLGLLHIPLLVDYLIYPDDRDGNIYELAQKAREPKQRRVEHRNMTRISAAYIRESYHRAEYRVPYTTK